MCKGGNLFLQLIILSMDQFALAVFFLDLKVADKPLVRHKTDKPLQFRKFKFMSGRLLVFKHFLQAK